MKYLKIFRNTPAWAIFLIDLLVIAFSVIFAYLVRFNFHIPPHELIYVPEVLTYMVGIRAISFVIARTYAGIIKYTGSKDVFRIAFALITGSFVFVLTNLITFYFITDWFPIPFSVIIIEFITSILLLTAFRVVTKVTFSELRNVDREKMNIIIFGAGEAGLITKKTLERDAGKHYKLFAYVDDDKRKFRRKIEGVNVFPTSELGSLLENNQIDQLIISAQNIKTSRKKELVDICLATNTAVLNVPPVMDWINGELSFKQFKKINIEDLLGRDEIKLNKDLIGKELSGKTVLISGASGSIGSELARQIAGFYPGKLILLDHAETPLFHLELEFHNRFDAGVFEIVLGDIRNRDRLERAFQLYKPDYVFHAAAYKHVPMMENNPSEAVLTNIEGTRNLVDLSDQYSVRKFVMISTDKAVNPTSVMGASKRIAEIYAQSFNKSSETQFITTRFGNVLGSNGSVIPLFKKQIEEGGPLTITHPDITRYFMTIPEACQLVLEASVMGKGGEIYIFDMGKSVKILDLAKKMIQLYNLELGKDIQIKYTGLRPGEKLYEELLNDKENTVATHHPQIMIANVREYNVESVKKDLIELVGLFDAQENFAIVKKMKEIVPEFISRNSVFEQLDKF